MRTVILGAGASGMHLARRLVDEGADVALVERDHDASRIAANALDCLVVTGDGSLPEVLREAGIDRARHFVALTGSDELNIVTCSVVAGEFPTVVRLARVRNPYYATLDAARRAFMGVDRFVNPDIETARALAALAAQGADAELVRLVDEDLVLRSARVGPGSPFGGRSLRESRTALGKGFLAVALDRGAEAEVPSGETVPRDGDLLYLLGAPHDLDAVIGRRAAAADRYRKVVIAGGGPVGRYLAEGFLGTEEGKELGLARGRGFILGRKAPRRNLVLVEPSMETCKELSRGLPGALVLCRGIGEEEVFLEEGLGGADLFIAVTDSQELNVLSAARAKANGVGHCLALSEGTAYNHQAAALGVDGLVSSRSNVASSIMEYLRGGALKTLHSFHDRGFKILEYSLAEGSSLHGQAIKDLRMPRGALVIFVTRRGTSSLPAGDTTLQSGDRLGIFTNMEAIHAVEELFVGGAR